MAFVVGWHSKMVLLPETPHKPTIFKAIGLYLDTLGVHLERGVDYYLSDPEKDHGVRAQEFAEHTYEQLSAIDINLAYYFGVATNLLLTLAECKCDASVPEGVRTEVSDSVAGLDLPKELQQAPSRNLFRWILNVELYFESLVGEFYPGQKTDSRPAKSARAT